jgi:DNA polymerase-3 subunit epsilon
MKKEYCIIDIETTGGMAKRDRITEIAIVVTDGVNIIEQYQSLVNPERSIPPEITRITGITNEMVASAPRFYEIAKDIILLTQDRIFIAHNVMFDYSFIREEFASLGYTFTRPMLCTVRLSRKVFPGLKSYSLGNLIRHFNIQVNDRHRAMEDTLATVKIFQRIVQSNILDNPPKWLGQQTSESKLPEQISREMVNGLPESAGVYFFYNEHGEIIYIGKSINIKKRISQHFSTVNSKMEKLLQKTADISYELTGSEIIALLYENSLIKKYNPEINRAQRRKTYNAAIRCFYDNLGYLCLESCKIKPPDDSQITFCKDMKHATMILDSLREDNADIAFPTTFQNVLVLAKILSQLKIII